MYWFGKQVRTVGEDVLRKQHYEAVENMTKGWSNNVQYVID